MIRPTVEMFGPSGRCVVAAEDVERYKASHGWTTSPPQGKAPEKKEAPAPAPVSVSEKGDAMAEAAAKELEAKPKSEAPKPKLDKPAPDSFRRSSKKSDKK